MVEMKTKKQRIQEKRNNIKMKALKKHNHYKIDCKGPRWRKRLAVHNDAHHMALATREIVKILEGVKKLYKKYSNVYAYVWNYAYNI